MATELEGLKAQYKQKIDAARAESQKYEGKEIPAEAAYTITKLLGESDAIRARVDILERIDAGEDFLSVSTGAKAALLGWRDAGPDEGAPTIDPQAWRELEIKTVYIDPNFGAPVQGVKRVRYHVPLCVQAKGYSPAYESYMRNGEDKMGPQDRKTLTEGLDSAGGFTVPEEYHEELIRKSAAITTIRSNARVISTSRDVAMWPKVHYTSDDRYTSGVRLTWTGELPATATVHRVTDPVFGTVSIPIHTAMASMPISNNLIEDSAFDIVGVSSDLLSEAFGLGENDAFINGSGVGRPLGILANVDGDGPASVKSGTAATLLPDGIIDVAYAIPAQYDRNTKWYMAKSTEKVIRKMKDTDNNYLWPIWPQVGNFGANPRELLGYPVIREEFMPAIAGVAYPIIVGDLTGYMVVDRVGFSIQRLSERYAEENITLLLARKRVGGQVVEPWRIKVQKVGA